LVSTASLEEIAHAARILELGLIEQRQARRDDEVGSQVSIGRQGPLPEFYRLGEQPVRLAPQGARLANQRIPDVAQVAAAYAFVEQRGDAVETGLVELSVVVEHAPIRDARRRHQHREHPLGGEADEAHVLQDDAVECRRHHEAELLGPFREEPCGHTRHGGGLRFLHPKRDGAPVVLRNLLLVQELVDEEAQPFLGGHATCRGMGLLDEPHLGELRERRADAGRGELRREHVGDRGRPDGHRLTDVRGYDRLQHPALAIAQLAFSRPDLRHAPQVT
jgi:hypothetical protein